MNFKAQVILVLATLTLVGCALPATSPPAATPTPPPGAKAILDAGAPSHEEAFENNDLQLPKEKANGL